MIGEEWQMMMKGDGLGMKNKDEGAVRADE